MLLRLFPSLAELGGADECRRNEDRDEHRDRGRFDVADQRGSGADRLLETGQADSDADGVPDINDCAPSDSDSWAVPGEAAPPPIAFAAALDPATGTLP